MFTHQSVQRTRHKPSLGEAGLVVAEQLGSRTSLYRYIAIGKGAIVASLRIKGDCVVAISNLISDGLE